MRIQKVQCAPVYGEVHAWAPLRSFGRIIIVYYEEQVAERVKLECDNLTIDATATRSVSPPHALLDLDLWKVATQNLQLAQRLRAMSTLVHWLCGSCNPWRRRESDSQGVINSLAINFAPPSYAAKSAHGVPCIVDTNHGRLKLRWSLCNNDPHPSY